MQKIKEEMLASNGRRIAGFNGGYRVRNRMSGSGDEGLRAFEQPNEWKWR